MLPVHYDIAPSEGHYPHHHIQVQYPCRCAFWPKSQHRAPFFLRLQPPCSHWQRVQCRVLRQAHTWLCWYSSLWHRKQYSSPLSRHRRLLPLGYPTQRPSLFSAYEGYPCEKGKYIQSQDVRPSRCSGVMPPYPFPHQSLRQANLLFHYRIHCELSPYGPYHKKSICQRQEDDGSGIPPAP